MKKTLLLCGLIFLFISLREIYYHIQIDKYIKILSTGEVNLSEKNNNPQSNAFYNIALKARKCTVKKLLKHKCASMRTYAYLIYLYKFEDINFDYLIKTLNNRSVIYYTNYNAYMNYRECFDSDVMLLFASKYPDAVSPFALFEKDYVISYQQIDSLLKISEYKEPVDPVLNREIVDWLNHLKYSTDNE